MKNRKKNAFIPFNLQFFAEPDDGSGQQSDDGNNGGQEKGKENVTDGNGNGNGSEKEKERTFTQTEVNRMMTKEKKEGKQSILNSLGFKTEEDAKNAFNLLKALQDSQKSDSDKKEEEKNTAIQGKQEAEKRAEIAEAKLSCIVNGVDKDSVEDVLTIAFARVSDDKSLDDVISEMKTQAKYSSFFTKEKDDGQNGTGSNPKNNSNDDGKNADYGKIIAEKYASKTGTENKSKFF